ncbi:MAG: hypothetical protein ACTHOK_17045 [Nocardioidaceae bacterium]
MRRRVVVLVVVLLLVVAAGGLMAWRALGRPSTYEQALGTLPEPTLRVTFTDWAVARERAGGTALGAASSRAKVEAFVNRAYDRDLTSTSALTDSTYVLAQRYGVSPLDAQWEILGQSREGQVDVMRVDDSVDLAGVERSLRTLGYAPPSGGSGTGGTWVGSSNLVAGIDSELTPIEQNVVVLADKHLVLMSDSADYVTAAADVARGSASSVLDVPGVASLGSIAREPVNAVLWASTFACEDLSMGAADSEDQRVGDQLVAKAGGITPLSGLVMARQPSGDLVVGMHFETSEQASRNLQARVDLAAGPAPGQGGSFRDRFRVTSGERSGSDVVLTLAPKPGRDAVLSDISEGPMLFATC